MSLELILAIIGIVSTPVGAGLTAVLMRRKYKVEIEGLKAEVDNKMAETRSVEIDNLKKGSEILMQQIVAPLEGHIKRLSRNVTKLEKAISKIPACPNAADCPVSRELLADEAGDDEPDGHGQPDRADADRRA